MTPHKPSNQRSKVDVSRIFAQHFPKLGPDLTDGTPYTTNLHVFLRPWVGSMNIKILGSMNLIKKTPTTCGGGAAAPPFDTPPPPPSTFKSVVTTGSIIDGLTPNTEYSRLQLRLNIAHCVTMCGKNFLWVELHGNGTALNTQESGSHADTLRECHICRTQFP